MKKIIVLLFIILVLILSFIYIMGRPEETDIVIIGAGASGMSAAIEAGRLGKDVILLEKMPVVGGNSFRATGGLNGSETSVQSQQNINDSFEQYYLDTLKSGHYTNDEKLANILIYNSANSIEWLIDLGVDLSDVGRLAGHSVDRTHRPQGGSPVGIEVMNTLKKHIEDLSIDLRLENKAISLMKENDTKVTGVIVQNKEGKEYKIKAKSVIISTGGFGGNPEMFVYYNKTLKGFKSTNQPGATGDFVDLIDGFDVELVDMSYIQTHPTVEPDYGVLITEALRGNGGILVNHFGNRFTNEMAFRDILSKNMLEQTNKEVYLIFDENIRQSLSATDSYVNMNLVIQAETLDLLAKALNINPNIFSQSIIRYNGLVEGGKDIDFGRNNLPRKIQKAPFYAIKVHPGVHYCMGGIKINERTQVISKNGEPIKGLFASGECTGGIHGANRLGGNSLIDAIIFGRIAGTQAALIDKNNM